MMRNLIDSAIGFFAPRAGLRRIGDRARLTRAYEGASQRDGWKPKRPGASANTDHRADAVTLRNRSRSLMQNVPYMAQALRSHTANIIGTGIAPRWTGKNGAQFDTLWKRWSRHADADGRLDVYGLQGVAYRAMQQDGEVLIRIRTRNALDRLPVPVQFQVLEIDWLDSARTGGSTANAGNDILDGIEYDRIGKVAGYWMFDAHPGEMNAPGRSRSASRFVPASDIIHLYAPDRPGQSRGMPRAAPVIAWVRDLRVYQDAEQQRKNLESRLSVLASGDVADMANPPDIGGTVDPASVQRTGELGPLASGSITQVPMGLNLTVVKPDATPGYVDYVTHQLHLIAAGFGVTYEMMTGDVSEVNFSSARIRLIDYRRECEMEQWQVVIPMLCDRMCRAFADAAELGGMVAKADYEVDYATPKWDYVNPAQDVRADLDEIAGGMSSISEKLRRRGYKPDQVFQELADDLNKLKDLGILDIMLLLQKGRVLGDGSGSAPPSDASSKQKKGGK